MICGIDEAGRGCVIGPLIVACVCVKDMKELPSKLKDSKKLDKNTRENIFKELSKKIAYKVEYIEPKEIDLAVEKKKLNYLEIDRMCNLIKYFKPKTVYIDSPIVNTKKFVKEIKNRIDFKCKIVAENKADEKYPIVSAASIVAKVIRDREIEKLKKKYGDFGSGYPSDPKTISFLREFYMNEKTLPHFVRKSWKTMARIKNTTLDQYI